MPRPIVMDGQGDFRGGLNLAADEDVLAPNELRRADDALLDEYGAIKKRFGSQKLRDTGLNSANPIQNGFGWLRDNGTQELLAVSNGTLYTASYAIPATWTSRSGSLKTTGTPAFAGFRDTSSEVAYLADGDSATSLNKWNGTTLTTNLASTPAGITQLAVYNQRLFGCTGADQKIYWSALNNGDTLGVTASGGGEAVVRTFGDQNITGLAAFGSSLLLFHQSGISRFTGLTQDDIAIAAGAQGVTTDVGAIAGRSIVTTPQGIYFLSDRGFYVATETQVAPISLKLDPMIRGLDLSSTTGIVGVHRRALKEVWWFLPDKGIYRYNYALGAWTGPCQGGYLSPATTALWEAQDAEGQPIVLVGDDDSFVKQADVPAIYRDNALSNGTGGTTFAMAVRCRRVFHGETLTFKAYKWAYLQVNQQASTGCSLTWFTKAGSGTFTLLNPAAGASAWGSGTWGSGTWGAGGSLPVRVPINGYGQYIDLLLSDGGEGQSVWSRVEVQGFDYGRRY